MARKRTESAPLRRLRLLMASGAPPSNPNMLRRALLEWFGLEIPTTPLAPGSAAPFDYLVHSFFEGTFRRCSGRWRHIPPGRRAPPRDCVVWAARGAGKTFLGAVATMLDLLYKKGIEVRILGGSLEQSERMHEHLRRLFESPVIAGMVEGRITERRLTLASGSRAQILAQSQTSIRGTRVQKLRCDEAELFDPEVWQAAQLTTRSRRIQGPWGESVGGCIEALSTMHRPYGLMWNLVGGAADPGKPAPTPEPAIGPERPRVVFRWGLIDVLGRCGAEHVCRTCTLEPECGGRAKERDARRASIPGHISVADAVGMKSRVSLPIWESEMLCLRPRRSDCVLPEFDPGVHIGDWTLAPEMPTADPAAGTRPAFEPGPGAPAGRRWVAGIDFGFRAPTVVLLAWYHEADPQRVLHVEAESVQVETTIDRHARLLTGAAGVPEPGWPAPLPALEWVGVDPAGQQRSQQTGHSAITALRKGGVTVRWRRLPLHEGLELVRARLRPAAGGAGPRLFVHRRCARLIESLQRYHFPEDRPEVLEPVKDGSDHAVDALRYLIVCLDRPHEAHHSSY